MAAGTALAAHALAPGCRVIGVEPTAGDDATRSFRTKTLQTVTNPQTVADGARTLSLGRYTLPLVLRDHPDLRNFSRVTLLQSLRCVNLALWDEERRKLVSFRDARARP
mgnify:CR=1 FL=1